MERTGEGPFMAEFGLGNYRSISDIRNGVETQISFQMVEPEEPRYA